jgi:perosamine synthetase
MLTTDDGGLVERAKQLRWMGITRDTWDRFGDEPKNGRPSWDYDVNEVGFKFQMNDLNAALGLVQLGRLESTNAQRREIVLQYEKAFADLDWFQAPVEKPYAKSAMHAYVARVPDRDGLIAHLAECAITAGVHYKPNHLYSVYEPYRRELPVTDSVWQEMVTLPLYPNMTGSEFVQVVEAVRSFKPKGTAS